jgi:hypothetical protein
MQADSKGHSYIYNLMYCNVKSSLNYFVLAVLLKHFRIATLLCVNIYNRTHAYNQYLYKDKRNDALYQRTCNPKVRIAKSDEQNFVTYCIKNKLKEQLLYLINPNVDLNITEGEKEQISRILGKHYLYCQDESSELYNEFNTIHKIKRLEDKQSLTN